MQLKKQADELQVSLMAAIFRGFCRRCPRCSQGKLYRGFYQLKEKCEFCGLVFLKDPIDVLAFMYISTAFITGLFILVMFWIEPSQETLGRMMMLVTALTLIIASLPFRKGVAIGIAYWVDSKLG